MSDEYEYGPWVDFPAGGRVQCAGKDVTFTYVPGPEARRYRIATPKPKRELVVGKWYRHVDGHSRSFCQCIFAEGEGGYFRWDADDPEAIWWGFPEIDWSTPPRDEAPE